MTVCAKKHAVYAEPIDFSRGTGYNTDESGREKTAENLHYVCRHHHHPPLQTFSPNTRERTALAAVRFRYSGRNSAPFFHMFRDPQIRSVGNPVRRAAFANFRRLPDDRLFAVGEGRDGAGERGDDGVVFAVIRFAAHYVEVVGILVADLARADEAQFVADEAQPAARLTADIRDGEFVRIGSGGHGYVRVRERADARHIPFGREHDALHSEVLREAYDAERGGIGEFVGIDGEAGLRDTAARHDGSDGRGAFPIGEDRRAVARERDGDRRAAAEEHERVVGAQSVAARDNEKTGERDRADRAQIFIPREHEPRSEQRQRQNRGGESGYLDGERRRRQSGRRSGQRAYPAHARGGQ